MDCALGLKRTRKNGRGLPPPQCSTTSTFYFQASPNSGSELSEEEGIQNVRCVKASLSNSVIGWHFLLHYLPKTRRHNIFPLESFGYKTASHHSIWQLGSSTISSKWEHHCRITRFVFFQMSVFIQPFDIFYNCICKESCELLH